MRQHPKVMNLPWVEKSAVQIVIIQLMSISVTIMKMFWLTASGNNSSQKTGSADSRRKARMAGYHEGVSLGSDAFFPFGDNIERAHKSGVEYIAQAGGSVRDDHVIDTCDKYGITMAFTGVRLFHH